MKRSLAWLTVACLAIPTSANAQATPQGLADLVSDLFLRGITLPGADNPGRPHAGHFTLGNPEAGGSQGGSVADEGTIRAIEAFSDRLTSQFAIFPLGSSSGGFTYSLDPAAGIYTRSSTSFGPAFTERARTIGRRKFSLGFHYQHSSFDTFAGEDLRNGSITFYLPHTDCCSQAAPPPSPQVPGFEGDIMETALDLKATLDTFAFVANFGMTDNLDLGVAVPLTRVDLDARIRASLIRLSTGDSSRVHTFVEGQDVSQATFSRGGSATGIGDVILRTKYNFLERGNTGLAVAVDLRLPTGDEDDLLGLGTSQGKFYLIASTAGAVVSPHVNIGFTVSGKGSRETDLVFEPLGVSDEFVYAGGIEYIAHPRLTILGDVLGRTLFDAGKVELEAKTFPFRVGSGAPGTDPVQTSATNPNTGQPYRQLALRDGNLSLLLGAAGFKFNAANSLLVSANFLFPLNNAGLNDRLTFAFGVDYAF
jgi:hypothetical protein